MKLIENKFLVLLILSLTAGLLIGWIDTRPNWNDTGVTVGMIYISSFILGTLAKRNVWVLPLIIGLCITLFNFLLHNNLQSAISFIISFAGAYSGVFVKSLLKSSQSTK